MFSLKNLSYPAMVEWMKSHLGQCIYMVPYRPAEGGQKDVLYRRTNIKKFKYPYQLDKPRSYIPIGLLFLFLDKPWTYTSSPTYCSTYFTPPMLQISGFGRSDQNLNHKSNNYKFRGIRGGALSIRPLDSTLNLADRHVINTL